MNSLTIGGVPEHFNLPWQDWIRRRDLANLHPAVAWRSFPGGTGAMIEALESGEIQVANLLTEGAVAGLHRGAHYSVEGVYVRSPLVWGIHVPANSRATEISDLEQSRIAVSRLGSGSHLMAIALGAERGWQIEDDRFVVVGSLQGAIEAFEAGRADVFLWERFMTQPVVDRGIFRRVGEYAAPWSAFVVCASSALQAEDRAFLPEMIAAVNAEAAEFRLAADTPLRIQANFGLTRDQSALWLQGTTWAEGIESPAGAMAAAESVLRLAGVIEA